MNRTPPIDVRRQLRREVGFGCPVAGCGGPYLTWHHFDPPWHEREHHDPRGMIALCRSHHDQADSGAFTSAQLREMKQDSAHANIGGRFNWLRHNTVFSAGSNVYIDTPVILAYGSRPLISISRDEDGYLLPNIDLLSITNEPRVKIVEGFWIVTGTPSDVDCPPSGRVLDVRYDNGDRVRVEFKLLKTPDEASKFLRGSGSGDLASDLPLLGCAFEYVIGGTALKVSSRGLKAEGLSIRNGTFRQCGPLGIGDTPGAFYSIPAPAQLGWRDGILRTS